MEIVEFLQLSLLLGLVIALAFLLTCFRRTQRLRNKRDTGDETQKEELRLHRNHAPTRQWARNWVGG